MLLVHAEAATLHLRNGSLAIECYWGTEDAVIVTREGTVLRPISWRGWRTHWERSWWTRGWSERTALERVHAWLVALNRQGAPLREGQPTPCEQIIDLPARFPD